MDTESRSISSWVSTRSGNTTSGTTFFFSQPASVPDTKSAPNSAMRNDLLIYNTLITLSIRVTQYRVDPEIAASICFRRTVLAYVDRLAGLDSQFPQYVSKGLLPPLRQLVFEIRPQYTVQAIPFNMFQFIELHERLPRRENRERRTGFPQLLHKRLHLGVQQQFDG